jgi:glycosyltransferase involved in cell wall biosynthesis
MTSLARRSADKDHPYRLAYVTTYDAHDIHAWSGAGYAIAQAMTRAHFDVKYIGDLSEDDLLLNKVRQAWYKCRGQRHDRHREPGVAKAFARQVAARLASEDVDLILSPGSIPIAYLDTALPMACWTDTTFAGVLDYYPEFSNISARTIRNAHAMEHRALHRCELVMFTSQWAADTAIRAYGVDPRKVHVVSFGPSGFPKVSAADVVQAIDARPSDRIDLLFAGVNWDRKGGDIAVAAAKAMNAAGINTTLHVVGCIPDRQLPPFVTVHGFISRRTEEGQRRMADLYSKSHFLILPTRAECVANVFPEACHFGLPMLASDTGGVRTAVLDGENGFVLPLADAGAGYAARAIEAISTGRYRDMALKARSTYDTTFDWEVIGARVRQLVLEYCF